MFAEQPDRTLTVSNFQVFSVLNDTEIPLLRDHVHTITNEGKRPDVEIMVENLGQFVFDHKLQKYVAENIPVV